MSILDTLIENLEAEGLLQTAPRTHLVLAYSGGADSTALLFLLNEIKNKLPLDVTAAYFNHRWRGNPPEELPLVHANCLKCNIPLVIIQADLTLPKTETAARQARYKQLTHLADDLRADAVLTAHHADDQIETLLFRILRGTGLDGLGGIQRHLELSGNEGRPVPILRPLLDISRKTLREYAEERGLNYFEDPTNTNVKMQRNNIRNHLFPMLEQAFPQAKNALFRLSLVAEGDLQIIEDSIQSVWDEVYGKDEQGDYLQALRFNQLGLPYQRRILKRFLSQHHIHADFQTIEDLLTFIRGEGRKNMDSSLKSLIHPPESSGETCRFLSLYKDRLRLIPGPEEPPTKEAIPVTIPGISTIESINRTFKAIAWEAPEKIKMMPIRPNDSQQVFVDLSAYADKPLELRTRRPGDKFQPMGMDAPLRLKKFLINRGVPRFERNGLLVLAHGNKVLWVPGLGISQELRIKDKAVPTHLLKLVSGIHPEPEMLMPPISEHMERIEIDEPENPLLLAETETELETETEIEETEQPTGVSTP